MAAKVVLVVEIVAVLIALLQKLDLKLVHKCLEVQVERIVSGWESRRV